MGSPSSPNLRGATIAFDLDGTLIDTAPDLIGALNLVLLERGLPAAPADAARLLVGRGARALISRGFALAGEPLAETVLTRLTARFIELYRGRIADESRPFPGLLDALGQLEAAGARLCVCTNKRTDLSVALLDILKLSERFVAIVGADVTPAPKPDPRCLLAALAAAGGDPGRAVMVGDSDNDVLAAKAAGVPVIAVSFGYSDVAADQLGAEAVIDDFGQLVPAVERLLSPAARSAA